MAEKLKADQRAEKLIHHTAINASDTSPPGWIEEQIRRAEHGRNVRVKELADAIRAAESAARREALEEAKAQADEVSEFADTSDDAIVAGRISDRIAALIAKEAVQ